MNTTKDILNFINNERVNGNIYIVGVDGPGGAGKTTFSEQISRQDSNIEVIHMDDFDLPNNGKILGNPEIKDIGGDTDWRRLLKEVIMPLKNNREAIFKPFDRELGRFRKKVVIKPNRIVIIEGVFSIRKELKDYYDLKIFLECDFDTRFARVLYRDGVGKKERWEKDWFPMEKKYFATHMPQKYADFVINSKALV